MINDKLLLFIAGVTLAVLVYLVIKVFQWRSVRKSQFPEPKRRSDVRRRTAAASATEAFAGNETPAVASSPGAVSSKARLMPQTAWPREPQQASPGFTSHDDELPYADGSDYVFGGVTPIMASLLPASDDGRFLMTKVLRNAGYYTAHAWQNFAAVRYLGLMLPVIFFLGLLLIVPEPLEWLMICGVVIGPILGWALPGLIVRSRAAERLRQMENGMPDMLDLMNMCVSQGMTVPAALGRVGRELGPVYPALSKELTIINDQARVGNLHQALTNFSTRVDVPEVHSFTSLLTQTERMGTSVSEALSGYSDSMRESMRQRADEKANSATFKLLFPTVVFLMPAVFLFLLGPAVIELNRFYTEGGAEVLNATDQIREFTNVESR